jgi:hypothetical protein
VSLAGCATQSNTGWTTLIDGTRGLDNFTRVGDANWSATDGAIQATAGGKDNAYLVSKDSYGNFTIRVEFWASDDANSGIFIRCTNPLKIGTASGYEVNIYDQRPEPAYGTGAIVGVAKVSPMPKAGGRWNVMEIVAKGDRFTVTFNGVRTVNWVRNADFAHGRIALQYGLGLVKFRKLQVHEI